LPARAPRRGRRRRDEADGDRRADIRLHGLQVDEQLRADQSDEGNPPYAEQHQHAGRRDAAGEVALHVDGRFTIAPAPAASAGATAAQFLDYDNDGLLDLLTWSPQGPHLFRNVGGTWADVTSRAFAASDSRPSAVASVRALASADVDRDGDLDVLVAGSSGVDVWACWRIWGRRPILCTRVTSIRRLPPLSPNPDSRSV
jgi:FG-GAP-like repeat